MIPQVLNRPYVVRDSIVTAAASLTTGTKTTLLAGDAVSRLDLVQIGFFNNSDAATTVALSDDGTTIRTFAVPVTTVTQHEYVFQIPYPQSKAGGDWQVDLPDITGTTVTVSALFIKQ